MATVRPKWSCVCEEPFVNYKVPNSIYKYFYFKTSTIASRRYLWGTVPHPASSPDLNAAAGGISRVTSIPSQGGEAVSLYFEATERWSATYRHGPGVGAGGGISAPWLMGVSVQRSWAVCPLVRRGWRVGHTFPHRLLSRHELWLPAEGTSTPSYCLFSLSCLAFPTPSILLSFPIESSAPQPLLSGDNHHNLTSSKTF